MWMDGYVGKSFLMLIFFLYSYSSSSHYRPSRFRGGELLHIYIYIRCDLRRAALQPRARGKCNSVTMRHLFTVKSTCFILNAPSWVESFGFFSPIISDWYLYQLGNFTIGDILRIYGRVPINFSFGCQVAPPIFGRKTLKSFSWVLLLIKKIRVITFVNNSREVFLEIFVLYG